MHDVGPNLPQILKKIPSAYGTKLLNLSLIVSQSCGNDTTCILKPFGMGFDPKQHLTLQYRECIQF